MLATHSSVDTEAVDCIIPAAGLSTRAGTWKLLLPYEQSTIIDQCIANALGCCDRVILVTGYRQNELFERYINHPRVLLVSNLHYLNGMFSSIKIGLSQTKKPYAFLCHADMPCVSSNIYRELWALRGDYTLIPSFQNRGGHPILLPEKLIQHILKQDDNSQLNKIIKTGNIRYHTIDSASIVYDIDTMKDYALLPRFMHSQGVTV